MPDTNITSNTTSTTAAASNIAQKVTSINVTEIQSDHRQNRKEITRELPKSHILRVASDTNVNKLAKTICGCIKDFLKCDLLVIGAGPTWAATKAYLVAKGELAKYNIKLKYDAGFIEPRPVIEGAEKTGVKISLTPEEM